MAVDGVDPANLERFDVTVRVVELLFSSSGEGVETLEMYVGRLASAFGLDIELLVLPEQVLLTENASGTSTALAIVRRTPGLSRLDQVMDLKVLVSDIEHGLPWPRRRDASRPSRMLHHLGSHGSG